MADKAFLKKKIEFRRTALFSLYDAYTALVKGGVKSYMVDDRQLTRLDIPALSEEIAKMEQELEALEAELAGIRPRKAAGVIPRDW